MASEMRKRRFKRDLLVAGLMTLVGLAISGASIAKIEKHTQMAQATQPLQGTPAPASDADKPAPSKPSGDRPTTPPPEPARPDADAQKAGAQPVLPPAPAEKTAPPIQSK